MPVGEMLARMDAREYDDWQAFERTEPFGERAQQLMVAQLTALVANIVKAKGGKPVKAEDLMPRYEAEREEMDWRTMKRMLMLRFPRTPQTTVPAARPGKTDKRRA